MDPMFNTTFLIATIISAIGIIYIIYSRRVQEISRKLYVLTLLLVIGYLISHFVHFVVMPFSDVTILDQSCHSFLLLIIVVLTFFSYYFHSPNDMSLFLKVFLIVPSVILIILLWTGGLIESSHIHSETLSEAHYSNYYAAYLIWYVMLLSLSAFFMVRKALSTKSKIIKNQIWLVLVGLIITNLTAFIFGLYLPWILGFYYLVEISPLAFFIGVILTSTLGLTKFNLFPAAASKIQSFSLNRKIIFSAVIVVPVVILLLQIPLGRILFGLKTNQLWHDYFLMSLFGGILVSSAMAFLITKIIANPLNSLSNTSSEILKGNYGIQVDISSSDELGNLARTFNKMSATLQKDRDDLELKQNRIEMLLSAFEKSEASICVLDKNGKIIELNSKFANILELKKENLYEESIYKRTGNNNKLSNLHILLNSYDGYNQIDKEISIPRDDFDEKYLVSITPFYSNQTIPAGFLLIAIDITEIKALEAQLANSEKLAALGKMAAVLTHEIKTPLTSIKMNTEMLSESVNMSDEDNELMLMIKKEINRLNELVNEVLQFAKQMPLKEEMLKIKDLINEIIDNSKSKFSEKNFSVFYEGNSDLVFADKQRLFQVFLNLIQNSFEAASENGHLWIKTLQNGNRIEIAFKDDGPGISKENIKKIFEPFHTTKAAGTGLGLAVARKIIEQHGGKIYLDSTKEGETIFKVKLKQSERDE